MQATLYGAIRKFNDRVRAASPALFGLEVTRSLQRLSPLDQRPLYEVNCPLGHDLGRQGRGEGNIYCWGAAKV